MAVRFDASGDSYTASLGLGSHSAWTVCGWFRIAVDRDTFTTFWALDSGSQSWGCVTDGDGTTLRGFDDGAGDWVFTGIGLTAGDWYFVGASISGGSALLYVLNADGTLSTDTSTDGSFTLADFELGNSRHDEWFNGNAAAVKIYTAGLSQDELSAEARQYQPRRLTSLQAWYPLVKLDQTDYSGNGHTLSGSGATREDGPPIPWGRSTAGLVMPVVSGVSVAIGQAAESDTARPLGGVKTLSIGRATESDTAQSVTTGRSVEVGQAAESDAAGALQAAKSAAIGRATETDVANRIATPPKFIAIGRASESDSAGAVTADMLPPWVLIQPTLVNGHNVDGLRFSHTVSLTVYGDDSSLTAEELPSRHTLDNRKYVFYGGHKYTTDDPAFKQFWIDQGFEIASA